MATKRKTKTKKDLEDKIAELEEKLSKLSTQIEVKPAQTKPAETKPAEVKPAQTKPAETKPAEVKPAETKPAETKPAEVKPAETKPAETKPAEVKPAETKPAEPEPKPITFEEALENAYMNSPMTDFHQYRAKVTGYTPAANRYFVRRTAPVGKVTTTNWNEQKAKVPGYTQPSNQYFATRARLAYSPPAKTFGGFSGARMIVDGVSLQQSKPEVAAKPPKPSGTLPKGMEQAQKAPPPPSYSTADEKSRDEKLEEYEAEYLQRIEQDKIQREQEYQQALAEEAKVKATTKASSSRGTLPKGFEAKPKPETPKKSKGTLPKGFEAKPAPEPKPEPKPETPKKSKGTLPKGFEAKPAPEPKPEPKPETPKKSKGTLPKGF